MEIKKLTPHLVALVTFIVLPILYNPSVIEGKVLKSGDIIHGIGNNKAIKDYRNEHGEEALWNPNLFSGMPAFQMSMRHYGNIGEKLMRIVSFLGKSPNDIMAFMGISFYLMLLIFGVNPWLSIAFTLGFVFSSFNIISLEAGHNWKIRTLASVPLIIGGVYAIFRNKHWRGFIALSLAMCVHITSNHFQITYYTLLMLLIFGGIEAFRAYKNGTAPNFIKSAGIAVLAAIIGVGPTIGKLWTTIEYSDETIRGGKSELTLGKDDLGTKSTGLDRDYAMRWSYGKMETFTLLIPYFKGGASTEELGSTSNLGQDRRFNKQILKQVPTYWGDQPFTSGPVYIGAVLIFLFAFGMFHLKGRLKWWLFSFCVVSIVLSWGRHFEVLTGPMFDYFPLYNKFRTPSMFLIMLSIAVPLLGALTVNELIENEVDKKRALKSLRNSAILIIGVLVVFGFLGSGIYDFQGAQDAQLKQSGWPMDKLIADRAAMLRTDTFRSLIFVVLGIAGIWGFLANKIKPVQLIAGLGLVILIDLWIVDKRYLNEDNFVEPRNYEAIHQANNADRQILQDPDPHFRVFNVSVNPFTDARTSYFHKSIGGYHAAKLLRYQELIEHQLSKNNQEVINMLNTKYFITNSDQQRGLKVARQNPGVNGDAWYVEQIKQVPSANEEMLALNNINTKNEAITRSQNADYLEGLRSELTTAGSIELQQFGPKHMIYSITNAGDQDQFVVFSEVYYEGGNNDWKSYIGGEYVDHIRVNYVLRGMRIPPGEHKVEFKFKPRSYLLGNQISLWFSVVLLLVPVGFGGFRLFKRFRGK